MWTVEYGFPIDLIGKVARALNILGVLRLGRFR